MPPMAKALLKAFHIPSFLKSRKMPKRNSSREDGGEPLHFGKDCVFKFHDGLSIADKTLKSKQLDCICRGSWLGEPDRWSVCNESWEAFFKRG